jgi:hypothetical protein
MKKEGGGGFRMFTQIERNANVVNSTHPKFWIVIPYRIPSRFIVPYKLQWQTLEFKPLIDWKSQKHKWAIL